MLDALILKVFRNFEYWKKNSFSVFNCSLSFFIITIKNYSLKRTIFVEISFDKWRKTSYFSPSFLVVTHTQTFQAPCILHIKCVLWKLCFLSLVMKNYVNIFTYINCAFSSQNMLCVLLFTVTNTLDLIYNEHSHFIDTLYKIITILKWDIYIARCWNLR